MSEVRAGWSVGRIFQGTFNMYVKVDKTRFYRKQWIMHKYYDFNKNNSTSLRLQNSDIS